IPQRSDGPQEVAERLVRFLLQTLEVRDPLRGLQDEGEPVRHALSPRAEGGFLRHAVESVVDLDRAESLRVVGEHGIGRDLFRVEGTLPLLVLPTAGAGVDVHRTTPFREETSPELSQASCASTSEMSIRSKTRPRISVARAHS